ncbi:MAG TPA: proton-conducting transporter membrane subunit [Ktedonobacterales bacterium]|nr:proton-conducting transporter membrane subunit [Ktedonobacterales bacterium]
MPLTVLFGLLTLAPLVMALALAGLGLARRATAGFALGLALVGVVIPIIGLALLLPEVSGGFPLEIALLGDQSSWVALYGRADMLGGYAALGVAVIVAPMLLWLAWRAAPLDAVEEAALTPSSVEDKTADEPAHATSDEASDEGVTASGMERDWWRRPLGRWQWMGAALALALETLALWICFAENIVLLGIVWVALVVVAWLLGELGSEAAIFDWRGLSLMVVGPVVWVVTTLLIAAPAGARRLLDLTGAGRAPIGHIFVISLALTFAAGGYPALAWLRKRASIAAPAGLAAVSLAVMPAAIFVGARTFSIGASAGSSWAALNIGKPSLTVGIGLTLLGAVSVAIAGVLALGRRDPRSLLASLTLAQAGWGLLGLGVGAPLSLLGVTLLLATSVIGLGAVIAALNASGAITADIEPESAGPRILGEPLRPALLFAWVVGVASLVGVPLLAGFAPLQLISAEALTGPRLSIPLVGLAWAGSALLAIALVRATAPAFTAPLVATDSAGALDLIDDADDADDADDGDVVEGANSSAAPANTTNSGMETPDEVDADVDADYDAETEDEAEGVAQPVATGAPELRLEELPSVALGVLIVLAGVAPAVAVTLASGAASATLQAGALAGVVAPSSSGYTAGVGQWYATAPVILVVVGALVLAYILSRMPREVRPVYLAGQSPEELDEGLDEEEEEEPVELVALPEPTETWSDLRGAWRSGWLTPGAAWLGLNTDDESLADDEESDHEVEDDGNLPDVAGSALRSEAANSGATSQSHGGGGKA